MPQRPGGECESDVGFGEQKGIMKDSRFTKGQRVRIPSGFLSVQFLRYTMASAIALVVDYSMYWSLAASGMLPQPIAAVAGYSAGLIVAYFLMAGRIFEGGWLMHRKPLEALLFFASGLFGALLTFAAVSLYVRLIGPGIHGAKIVAVGVSFVGVYFFRKTLVFRRPT